MREVVKKYSNGEVTVVWTSKLCTHSGNCVRGLPEVFNLEKHPWINVSASETETVAQQVRRCPSGALSYFMNENEAKAETQADGKADPVVIDITENGPVVIRGPVIIRDAKGRESKRETDTALCRCGSSGNKPYCDGSHKKIGFSG